MPKYYDGANNRLVFCEQSSTPDFWDKHWNVDAFKDIIQMHKNDRFILENTRKYLKEGTVLEGGCGMGGNVYCLHNNGYSAYGVDFAENTVAKINESCPELKVTVGDVRKLPFENEFFDGYWSLGVIEHFFRGYDEILKEMQRVVRKNGYVFLTFPFMSPLRNLKAKLGMYPEYSSDNCNVEKFYQFALDARSVENNFKKYGFQLQYSKSFDGLKGLKSEVSVLRPVLQPLYNYKGNVSVIRYFRLALSVLLAYFFGHIVLLIFKKAD